MGRPYFFVGPTNPQGLERKNQKRDPSKANQEEMSPEKNKTFVIETRNTEDGVLYFRGKGCNLPLLCPGIFCNSLGEELKAKAPPKTAPCGL